MTIEPLAVVPSDLTYGYVADRVLLAIGDTTRDPDRNPDMVAATGTVTFTPVSTMLFTEEPKATVIKQPITARIHLGSMEPGDSDPAKAGLLIDSAEHVGNVSLIVGRYNVTYSLQGGVSRPGFPITVTDEHTEQSPLWLPDEAPIPQLPTERWVVNEQIYRDTLAARDEVNATLAGLSDPLDTAIDATIANPDSDSHARLLSTIGTEVVAPARQAAMEYLADEPEVVGAAATRAVVVAADPAIAAALADPGTASGTIIAGLARKTHIVVGLGGDYATLTDALAANTGGNLDIELTTGEHTLPETITVQGVSNVTIRGQGRGATTVCCDQGFIHASRSSDSWEVHSLTIAHTAGANTHTAFDVSYPRRWSIRRTTITGFGGDSIVYRGGVHSEAFMNYIIARDSVNENGHAGIHITFNAGTNAPATTVITRQNYVAAGKQYGYLFDRANVGCESVGDVAEYCQVGIRAQTAGSMLIVSPYTEANDVGIQLHDSPITLIGRLRDEPVRTWSGVGIFDRRTVRLGEGWIDPGKGLNYAGPSGTPGDFTNNPSLRWDTTSPDGRLTAPVGSLGLATAGGPGTTLWVKESGTDNHGWTPLGTRTSTSGPLNSAANSINTAGKRAGAMVFNTVANRPVWATGSVATDPWVYADGTTAHTPT